MIPKSTENTVTSFLREEIEKLGVNCVAFASINTPIGRREIDLLCKNSGLYPCEAKFTEKDLLEAIGKIQNDYFKYHKELNIKGGFALLYPIEFTETIPSEIFVKILKESIFKIVLMFLPEDTRRNFTVFSGTLKEIAQIISKQVLEPPEVIEPNIDWIIKSLRESAIYITIGLKNLAGNQLDDIFGGQYVFKNILQYEKEDKYPIEEIRLASAYLLVNQLLFYQVLSSKKQNLPVLESDQISFPSELNKYFQAVLEINYKAVFSYDVASRIPWKYNEIIKQIINVIKGIGPEKIGGDLLGTIFHDLIPLDVRKYVAAYYTNIHAADLLATLSIDNSNIKVTDFAVGSGGLLVAAYRRKKELLERTLRFTQKEHENFIEQLLGVDVMPFAASVAACHLALQTPEYFTNRVKIAVWDSTELNPNIKIPSIATLDTVLTGHLQLDIFTDYKENSKGVIQLGQKETEEIILDTYDLIMMNPPFTRQERIPSSYKILIVDRFKKYKKYLHGQLGYYGYFLLLADKFLNNDGRLAFVLPAAFLRTRSAEGIRKYLSENYNIEYIITGLERLNFSESTWRREILFIAKKLKQSKNKIKTVIIGLNKIPNTRSEIKRFSYKIQSIKDSYKDQEINAFSVSSIEIKKNLDWFRFIAPFLSTDLDGIWNLITDSGRGLAEISDIYDTKKIFLRGIETKKDLDIHYFYIHKNIKRTIRKGDVWILDKIKDKEITIFNRYTKNILDIPKHCIVPCLRTIAGNKQLSISDKNDFLVVKDFPNSDAFLPLGKEYYRRSFPTIENYAKNRAGNIIFQRRFIINAPGTIHLCYYSQNPIVAPGTTWVGNLDDKEAKILCLWFNSSINLAQIFKERIEDIWLDIHKYIFQSLYVINPKHLSNIEKKKMLDLFGHICSEEFPSLIDQINNRYDLRQEIDMQTLKILGYSNNQSKKINNELHESLKEVFYNLSKT